MFAPLLPSLVAPSGSRASLHALRGACQTFEMEAFIEEETIISTGTTAGKKKASKVPTPCGRARAYDWPTHREEVGGAAEKLMPLPTHKTRIRVRSGQASPLHPLLLPSIPPTFGLRATPSAR